VPNSPLAIAAVVFIAAGCQGQSEPAHATTQDTNRITVDDKTYTVSSVKCFQVQWLLTVEAAAGPSRVTAMLQLGGETPTVRTVNIENFDGFYGVSGRAVADTDAEATFADGTYTITGNAEGANSGDPTTQRTAPFRIEARCEHATTG
jgi:hypothetical protein